MSELEKFLEKYKRLFGLVHRIYRNNPYAYTEHLDTETQNKMNFCRHFRNYCQHNADFRTFVSVTPDMVRFLDTQIRELSLQLTSKEYETKKIPAVTPNTSIRDACKLITKWDLGWLPTVDENGSVNGALDETALMAIIGKAKRLQ